MIVIEHKQYLVTQDTTFTILYKIIQLGKYITNQPYAHKAVTMLTDVPVERWRTDSLLQVLLEKIVLTFKGLLGCERKEMTPTQAHL